MGKELGEELGPRTKQELNILLKRFPELPDWSAKQSEAISEVIKAIKNETTSSS